MDLMDRPRSDMQRALNKAITAHNSALESAVERFRECGVEIERFTVQHYPRKTVLCVDNTPRFTVTW